MYRHDGKPVTVPYNPNLKRASQLLRTGMTEAEKHLWQRLKLKHLGCMFYRQKPIGDYIVDFYCPKARLVIEVDGDYHKEPETQSSDGLRENVMRQLGIKTLRFKNVDVLSDTESVVEKIKESLA
jgi:very-short-patch-repair endonuclease